MRKRIFSILTVFCLCLSLLPAALAAESNEADREKVTTLIVATDRHESNNEFSAEYTGRTNNLIQVLETVKAAGVVEPDAILLSGDNIGGSGKNADFPFYLSDMEEEVAQVFEGIDCYFTYGSHDKYALESHEIDADGNYIFNYTYDGFLSGPQEMDGYYLYGISFSQMQFATRKEALDQYAANVIDGEDQELDMADPNGICAEDAAANFLKWIKTLDDNKPIVVGNHIPMHALRDDNMGGGIWAKALNEAAKTHDIFFIWGHNHTLEEQFFKGNTKVNGAGTKDRDYYLVTPGSTLEFPTGEAIPMYDENGEPVLKGNGEQKMEYPSESIEIQFTYMNAGYLKLGYCSTISFVDNEQDGIYDEVLLHRFSTGAAIEGDEAGAIKDFGTTGYTSPTTLELAFATKEEIPAEPVVETYVVQRGDSLWSIAAKTLGDGKLWGSIYEANADSIKNPSVIQPGQILTLP